MAITYEIAKKEGIVSLWFSAAPTIEEYEATLPVPLMQIDAANINKWLVILDYVVPGTNEKDIARTEFVFRHLNRYISRIAVVCPVQWYARVNDVLEPISNQGKAVELFQSIDDARDWLVK